MTDTTQMKSCGLLTSAGIRLAPMRLGTISTGEDLSRLPSQVMDPASVMSSPACAREIHQLQGAGLRIARESEPFIPSPGEMKKFIEGVTNGLEPIIRAGEEAPERGGDCGPGSVEHRE